MKSVSYIINAGKKPSRQAAGLAPYSLEEAARAQAFHESFAEYAPTPLVRLRALAADLGLGGVFVKDESKRFGLNAFKVLGGAYAMGRYLAAKLGTPIESLTREKLCSPEVRQKLGDITFVTATDGNHGRGVAWTAQQLGQKAVVFMPKGSARARAENIRKTGATCTVTDLNYDDAVRLANQYAEAHDGVMVQDTAWEGYEDIPRWIMQGYMTLAHEAAQQLREYGVARPTHLFLQAGVGSFAGAVLGYFAARLGEETPVTTIVEPRLADCIYGSLKAADGAPHAVTGHMPTIMAGLACGEPSTVSWNVLRDYATAALACDDCIAANGMRILASPHTTDAPVVSGESGAVTVGALEYIMKHESMDGLREALGLNARSQVLLVSTEGDTSPEMYRNIVWYGQHPCQEEE